MNTTRRDFIMQRWNIFQREFFPELQEEIGVLTEKLKKVIYTLEWVRVEEFVESTGCGIGRPPHERAWMANAFVAKAVLGLSTTTALIERLKIDRALRRICGFAPCKELPSEATFSRAFGAFAQDRLDRSSSPFGRIFLGVARFSHKTGGRVLTTIGSVR
jgi:hypothetical protein